jgi:glutamate racemase
MGVRVERQRVGIFDSGVGGLSVWREIARLRPDFDTVYVADQAHIPYGPRDRDEIRSFARGIVRFLIESGSGTVVVACNAASAAALASLRVEFPDRPFVGMEPAVKPAAEASRRRVAGVLATPATLQGELFATTVERFAADVRLVRQVCPGLVERIEAGDLDGPATQALLRGFLRPSLEAGADTLVLACTHYPFVRPLIEALAGPEVRVIDPAPAVARQVERVTGAPPVDAASGAGRARFYTTGDADRFAGLAARLLGMPVEAEAAVWSGERLTAVRA